ncbi:MAG: hypothetical protein K1X94_29505 [Sandaracinaceae bacterium]|nr:hypothetical protein [Sandaracinaceae bacterium]
MTLLASRSRVGVWTGLAIVGVAPWLMAPSCGGGDTTAVPDVGGTWSLTFADDLSVEVDIGGEVYNPTLAGGADTVTVMHDGMPVSYTVDCSRDLVVCPSELLPATVTLVQPRTDPRSLQLQVTESECRGGEISEGQCTGTLVEHTSTREGVISADGSSFTIVLGGGAVVAGSCALLTLSLAEGDLVNSGTPGMLRSDSITNGTLTTAVGGGCLLVGMADLDPALEAAAAGGSVQLHSSFTATRVR